MVTGWQIFCIVFLFQLGSSAIFGYAGHARQDAWIVAIVSTALGCALVWLYARMFASYPQQAWTEILSWSFGKYLGQGLAMLYVVAFIYDAARVLRDFGELIHTFFLPHTPMGFSMFFFLAVAAYACVAGLERMIQFAELNIGVVFIFLVIPILLLIISNAGSLSLLEPVASDWQRIGAAIFPLGITVPFGETFVFAMFLPKVTTASAFRRSALLSSAAIGFFLLILDLEAVCVLGPELFSRSFYPALSTFQMINVADFVENVDPLIVSNFLIGGFFKILVFFYAACSGIAAQWKLENHRSVIIPVFLLILLLALYMTDNIATHLFFGWSWAVWILWLPLFVIVPLLALAAGGFRTKLEGDAP